VVDFSDRWTDELKDRCDYRCIESFEYMGLKELKGEWDAKSMKLKVKPPMNAVPTDYPFVIKVWFGPILQDITFRISVIGPENLK
jgi:hypothetical protein